MISRRENYDYVLTTGPRRENYDLTTGPGRENYVLTAGPGKKENVFSFASEAEQMTSLVH